MSGEPDKVDVAHVAHLARLELTPEEQATYANQLRDILTHMAKLRQVDITGVEPTAHAVPLRNVWRADEPGPTLDRGQLFRNAPEHQRDLFIVPRIIE